MVNKKVFLGVFGGIVALSLSMVAVAGGDVASCENCLSGKWYVGGSVGYGNNHWGDLIPSNHVSVRSTGVATGADIGYMFNQYIGLEGGFMYLPVAKAGDGRVRDYAFDVVAKLVAPLDCIGLEKINLFGKAGVSYLRSRLRGAALRGSGLDKNISNVNVTYAVGAGWQFMPNLVADVTFQRFHGRQDASSSKHQPFMDAITVGLTYHLGGELGNLSS